LAIAHDERNLNAEIAYLYCKFSTQLQRSLVIILLIVSTLARAQDAVHFNDTINKYNKERITTNLKGMQVLGVWGIANVVTGIAGSAFGKGETQAFFEMNTAFGVFNTSFAYAWYARNAAQAARRTGNEEDYQMYRSDKQFFVYKTIFDLGVVATGVALASTASSAKTGKDMYSGFSQSCLLQGICMMGFDDVMALLHNKSNYKWLRIMDELRFSGMSMAYVHRF